MKRERNIITIKEYGKVAMPTDIGATTMTECELCNLFGITAPTFRAEIKALCKSGVLRECEIRQTIRISDKCSVEIYNLETITALAFHIGTYGAEQVRQALLDRIMYGRKEKTTVFVSLLMDGRPTAVGKHDDISTSRHIIMQSYQQTNLLIW